MKFQMLIKPKCLNIKTCLALKPSGVFLFILTHVNVKCQHFFCILTCIIIIGGILKINEQDKFHANLQ